MENTTNYNLNKPDATDNYNRMHHNNNMDIIDTQLKENADNVGDMSTVPTTAKDAAGAIIELFQSVSDGKTLVAAAITDKGVPTAADDTFEEMADNIDAIPVGPDTSDATAVAADILASKTAYGAAGTKLTGTMVDRGTVNITPSTVNQTIAAGKHSGSGVVAGDADLVSANIKSGANIFNVAGNANVVDTSAGTAIASEILAPKVAFVDGAQLTGTMVDRAGDTASTASAVSGTTLRLRASVGFRDGTNDYVTITDANFIAANILLGKTVHGLAGSLVLGKKNATGQGTANASGAGSVTGLGFQASLIILDWASSASAYNRASYRIGDSARGGDMAFTSGTSPTGSGSGSFQNLGTVISNITSNGFSVSFGTSAANKTFDWVAVE